jgi:hypothetical protein
MTEQQRNNLQAVATAALDNFVGVSESFIIGRIMKITGKPYAAALAGYKLMVAENMIPATAIDQATAGALQRMTQNNPLIEKLIEKFSAVPGHSQVTEYQIRKTLPKWSTLDFKSRISNSDF